MNPTEQRVRIVVGDLVIANAALTVQLEEAQAKVSELEKQLAESKSVILQDT
mgnify:CR=1